MSFGIPPLLNPRVSRLFSSKSFTSFTLFCGEASMSQYSVGSPGCLKMKSALRDLSGS